MGAIAALAGLLILSCLVNSGAEAQAPKPAETKVAQGGIDLDNQGLSLAGSNTIGASLAPALLTDFVLSRGAGQLGWTGLSKENEARLTMRKLPKSGPSVVELRAHGTGTGFEAVANAQANIAMASRRIKPEEMTKFASQGDWTAIGSEIILGLDGLVILAHPANPVQSLSLDQIAGMFTGRITNWSQVGGADLAVNVYARDDKSGTFDTFKSLILKDSKLVAGARRFESGAQLSDSIVRDRGAIGFVGLGSTRRAKPLAINECGVTHYPDAFSIKTEEYPLTRRLYLYAPPASRSMLVDTFLSFAQSDAGQQAVDQAHFVSLVPELASDQAMAKLERQKSGLRNMQDTRSTQRVLGIIGGARQLSTVFRFENSKAVMDARSRADIAKVAQMVGKLQVRSVNVLGFADSRGDYQVNLSLSRERAKVVADALRAAGVRVGLVEGFGEEMPIACNTTESGAERNRRVEIWVR